ncbi:MAG: hypothetical protein K1X94_26690 [Sandaracinaceae bacterium]|nr:hypothetical protein [Sandaracinaceae bacterium]
MPRFARLIPSTLLALSTLASGCDRESQVTDAAIRRDAASPDDAALPADAGAPDAPPLDAFVPPPPDIHVRITGDNAYAFGFGPLGGLSSYYDGFVARVAGDIFNCSQSCAMGETCTVGTCDVFGSCNEDGAGAETFVVPGTAATAEDYLYIVAWSDDGVTQGVIGQFVADGVGSDYFTGAGGWEVCATGMDFDTRAGDPSPDRALVEAQIAACNSGSGQSGGWVDQSGRDGHALVVGEANDPTPGGSFPPICTAGRGDSIGADARWIWYDDDTSTGGDPFHSSDPSGGGEFLIFRLQIQELLI